MKKVTLICGAPGSGKTTYAKNHMLRGDILIDVDAIFRAISGLRLYDKPVELLSFVLAARDYLTNESINNPAFILDQVFIIHSGAKRADRNRYLENYGAEIVVLETPSDECLRRIAGDPDRQGINTDYESLIAGWWENYEPQAGDTIIRPEFGVEI